jgi:hypothetical protein
MASPSDGQPSTSITFEMRLTIPLRSQQVEETFGIADAREVVEQDIR